MSIRSMLPVVALIAAGATVTGCVRFPQAGLEAMGRYDSVPASPRIEPDYGSLVIPPEFAPLNFIIREPGIAFFTDIHGAQGDHISITSVKKSKTNFD